MDDPFPAVLAASSLWASAEEAVVIGVPYFLLAWLLAVLAAFFRAALEEYSRTRLIEPVEDSGRKERLERAVAQEEQIESALSFIQVCCEAWCLLALAFYLDGETHPFGFEEPIQQPVFWAFGFALLALFPTVHVLPRGVMARGYAESVLRPAFPSLALLSKCLSPVTVPLLKLSGRAGRLLQKPRDGDKGLLTDEIIDAVEESERAGAIEEDEAHMIENVLELQDLRVGEIMTPRTDMTSISVESTLEEAVRLAYDSGHSKIPVYRSNRDEICGIFQLRDAIPHLVENGGERPTLEAIVVPAVFVPDSKRVAQLLREFQSTQQSLAIVLDEYGGTEGLLTVEDILEEIVGELREQHDQEEAETFEHLESGAVSVDPRMRIDEINEEFSLRLPESEDYDTLGGFVYAHLDRIPVTDEEFVYAGVEFKVLKVEDRRIARLQLRALPENGELRNGHE